MPSSPRVPRPTVQTIRHARCYIRYRATVSEPPSSEHTARWDPAHYLRFADHRTRPGLELIARIPDADVASIVDLGCGTGHLTAMLAERFPEARVLGVDASEEMIEVARADHPDIDWVVADLSTWAPDVPVDVVYSNATLHWLDDHASLFPRIRSWVAVGGTLAVQMPDNWRAPTHVVPARVLDDGSWPEEARSALMRDRLAAPGDYRRWLQPAEVDLWRTTYHQTLVGADPVWAWVTGSVVRPVLAALAPADRVRFETECRARYREAYPEEPDGTTLLPFSRLFMVAIHRPDHRPPPDDAVAVRSS